LLPIDDTDSLSRLYHLNSEPWLNVEAYSSDPYEVGYKEVGETTPVPLPVAGEDSTLLRLLRDRRSCRAYAARTAPLELLATLLSGACGLTGSALLPNGFARYCRPAPSAGGLYPLEIYVLAKRTEGLPDALYHYRLRTHALEVLRTAPPGGEIAGFLLAQPFLENANFIFLIAAVFGRTQKKYGPRGYRYVLLEAGHVAQSLCLLATERQLGSLCVGGFLDAGINRFVGLDGVAEAVVYGVGVGYPANVAPTPGQG
jgi:SagB-type dehydrogenase family enzyme